MKKVLNLSVHQLVDFLLRTGDLDNRVFNNATMQEGSKIHALYQAKQGKNYLSEYPLKGSFSVDGYEINLEGRADGIMFDGDEAMVDEIKSTIVPLEEFYEEQKEWHLGQAKCYGLLFCKEKGLKKTKIKLTYIHQLDNSKLYKFFDFSLEELEQDIQNLLHEYIQFYNLILKKRKSRNKSCSTLEFPFKDFRKGQKRLAKYCYTIATKGGILFAEAPTGIGKTISTLFPFVKSFAEEKNEKIFYLTAKNSGKETAFDTTTILQKNGLKATDIIITAKEKICLCPGKACNPDECPFAKGYYNKIQGVIISSLKNNISFSRDKILEIAQENAICPFELSLDLSLFSDIIICDYNYFFDPLVYLQRFFDDNAPNFLILVDEAHNLVERGRQMYSASFSSYNFIQLKRSLRHFDHKKIKSAMSKIMAIFNIYKEFPVGQTEIQMLNHVQLRAIENFLLAATDVNKHHHSMVDETFKTFFYELNKFYRLLDYYDETFKLYVDVNEMKDVRICLYCVDPRERLRQSFDKAKSKVVFSATLSPAHFYIDMIGGQPYDPFLRLPSPFNKDQLKLLIAPMISIKYKKREQTINEVASYIKEMVKSHIGNYFVYVPSYEYMEKITDLIYDENYDLLVQQKDMSDSEKEMFLSCFKEKPERTTVGLAVVGGAFGEGIDLVSDRLIGVAVVGVGLPQICYERNLIKDYFEQVEHKGYSYAYVNPGMNKVMQAVGRVIRSETDRGVALLIDDRLLQSNYRDLFKTEWDNYEVVTSVNDIKNSLELFWSNK